VAHVDVDGSRLAVVGTTAEPLEQLPTREHDARARGEDNEHLELDEGQLHHLAPDGHRAPGQVDSQLAPLENLFALTGEVRRRRATQQRADTAPELADREGLGDVVVGAELEPEDLVELLAASSEHDDRDVALRAYALADLEAVESREHDVEHDEVERVPAELPKRFLAVTRLNDAVPVALEGVREQRLNRLLVVDEENCGRRRHRAVTPASGFRRAYYSPAMEAPRPRRRRRRLGRSGTATTMDGRLVRVGLVVLAPALVALLFAVSTPGTLPRSPLQPLFDGKAAQALADTLSLEFPSRVPGSLGAEGAARWYSETMSGLGISAREDRWEADLAGLGSVTLENVVSEIPGRSDHAIIVVAHRDNAGSVRPGVDNATGTAALLELARSFAPVGGQSPRLQHTLVLVSTDGGAYGGAGAARFVETSPFAKDALAAVVLDDLAGQGATRIAIASDASDSPPQTLVRTAIARVAEETRLAPRLPSVTTQLLDLGMPFADDEQGRLLGGGIAALTLTTSGHPELRPHPAEPTPAGAVKLDRLGKATEALVDSLDASARPAFRTPDSLYFGDRALSGWAFRLTLVVLVVPITLGTVDLVARSRRRGLTYRPALRALRTRLFVWLGGVALLALGAVGGVFPTGENLPLPTFVELVTNPPVGAISALAAVFAIAWVVARRRLVPRRDITQDERLAGMVVALVALCGVAIALAVAKPYALVFVLPSLYAWPWIPLGRISWRGPALFLVGLAGPLLGLLLLANQVGIGVARAALYVSGLATVGYVSLGSVLAAVAWAAVAAQFAAVAFGRYAPYADGAEPPPPGLVRSSIRHFVRRR